ncbi:MAG: DUF3800 domain-containing protein [Chloroflexi bacterium]|nr:DUF3800 domain-containing protein [Chloroflexota bacterium]
MSQVEFFAFVDESGSLPDLSAPVVVVAVLVVDAQDRGLERLIPKIRRGLPGKGTRERERQLAELKFFKTSDKTRRQVLLALKQEAVTLFVLVVDKKGFTIPDTPSNHAMLMRQILPYCLERFPHLRRVFLDSHFAREVDERVRSQLIEADFDETIQVLAIDSMKESRINLADFVAGAVAFAHKHDDARYEELIRSKIAMYRVVRWDEKEKW